MFKNFLEIHKIIFKFSPKAIILKIIFLILAVIITPINILLMQKLIDNVYVVLEGGVQADRILFYGGALSLSMFISASLPYLEKLVDLYIEHNLIQYFTPSIILKFSEIEYSNFDNQEVLNTIHQMGDKVHEKLIGFFNASLKSITGVLSIMLTSFLFLKLSPLFWVGFLMILLPMLYFDYKSTRIIQDLFDKQSTEQRKQNYLMKLITNKHTLYELKIFRGVDYVLQKWKLSAQLMFNEEVKTTFKSKILLLISTTLLFIFTAYVMYFLTIEIQSKRISIGLFIALVGAIESIYVMTYTLSGNLAELVKYGHIITHYFKFMNIEVSKRPITVMHDVDFKKVEIEFKDVYFTYPNSNTEVLKGISFKFSSNESIAIVGRNGAGKSTIIKLICGLYRIDEGKILINGININEFTRIQLKEICSVVFQDYSKFNLTLRENIALANIQLMNEKQKIYKAMEQGLVEKEFRNLIDHPLGNLDKESRDLSEGQWQRIAIARACFSNTAFIILDEPTASIDPIAESKMYNSFVEILGLRGCIIISHRLASAKICQKVMVLEEGKIIAIGSHDYLMKYNAYYAKMFKEQSWWYLEKESNVEYENL